jgi:very-short-patch-repair endonuclease
MAKKKNLVNSKYFGSLNNIEKKVYDILKDLNIAFKTQVTVDKYNVDFLVEDKYIIEVYGDFWHCNPQKYKKDYFNRGKKKTAAEIWERDAYRKKTFESSGYKFLHLWETEINSDMKLVRKKIKKLISNN